MTAGHCIFNKTKENIRVLLNFYDTNEFDEKKHSYKIEKFIVHPDYIDDLKQPKQDIGLIKLEKEIDFKDNEIAPICLPDKKPHNDNDTFYGFLTTGLILLDFVSKTIHFKIYRLLIPISWLGKIGEK